MKIILFCFFLFLCVLLLIVVQQFLKNTKKHMLFPLIIFLCILSFGITYFKMSMIHQILENKDHTTNKFEYVDYLSPYSKKDIIAYVEKEYGKTPKIISIQKFHNQSEKKETHYTLQLAENEPPFTIVASVSHGDYGPIWNKRDYYNRDMAFAKQAEAKALAETYHIQLETDAPTIYDVNITLYLEQTEQLNHLTQCLLELDKLYAFVYPSSDVNVKMQIVLQNEEVGKITEQFSFQDFQKAFSTPSTNIGQSNQISAIKNVLGISNMQHTKFEDLSPIMKKFYHDYHEQMDISWGDLVSGSGERLSTITTHHTCNDCQGTGFINNERTCETCQSIGYIVVEHPSIYDRNEK